MMIALWCIPTAFGDAMRGEHEAEVVADGALAVKAAAGSVPALVPKGAFRVLRFDAGDTFNPRGRTEVRNVCGFVAGYAAMSNHPAWRKRRSALGTFNEAYTLRGGNCIFLRGKAIFKGGTDCEGVRATMRKLVTTADGAIHLKAYLLVATAHLHRNICVQTGCLMEAMLAAQPGVRVMRRHEELSNAVIFYINDWAPFDVPADARPAQGTISVSRRGVVNARYTWHDGAEWGGNEPWVRLTESVRAFLLRMC